MCAATGSGNPVIFAVISVLVVALVYSPTVTSYVFAVPADSKMGTGKCTDERNIKGTFRTCCWRDNPATTVYTPPTYTCQTCKVTAGTSGDYTQCTQPEIQFLTGTFETQPTFPSGPVNPPGDVGVLEETEHPTGGGTFEAQPAPLTPGDTGNPKIAGGFNTQPPPTDEGAAGAPPSTAEETQSPTLTEEQAPPVCIEGQVLDEESGLCVLEEPEQSQPEEQEQQPSEEGDGSEDGNNDDNDN